MRQLPRHPALAAVLLLLTLYAVGVADHDLWTPDEPRVAAVGRAAARGAWVAPTLNGVPFLEEPPLHAWCVGLFYRFVSEAPAERARWLSALFGIAGLVFTGLLAGRLAGPKRRRAAAVLSALSLGVALEYCATAHRLVVDGALALFTTGAAYFFWRGVETHRTRSSWLHVAAGAGFSSLAFLTKGAIGLAVPGLFCAACLARAPRGRRLLLPLVAGGPVVLALVAGPWLVLVGRELGSEAFRTLFVDNTLGRVVAAAEDRGHVRPLLYYVLHFPAHFFPATLALAGALLHRFGRTTRLTRRQRLAYDVSLLWLALGLLMLSLAATKRGVYLVPLLPAAAIPCGLWLEHLVAASRRGAAVSRYGRALPYLLAMSLAAAGLAVLAAPYWLEGVSLARALLSPMVAVAAALAVVSLERRGQLQAALLWWLTGLVLTSLAAVFALFPPLERLKALGPITREIARTVPAGEPLYLYDPDETTEALLPLYADRLGTVVRSRRQLDEILRQRGTAYVLAVDKTYRRSQRRYEALLSYRPELLVEDLRPRSRAFRLARLVRPP